ncbi:GTPase Era [Lapidilactobacillus concavus DSM 17758]|uniref:GTPase Era n=1 Tax=Lapidilactobacillus concavus DSM 17758 TaxID=1423735 RepID=A0A0R1VYV4_9LACO|nr:GTPase Era [Lapidilactobacillus concavus]KRM10714.1 GTPase Era [Lapidilactobacillus concavus DSM 17758]GEL12465.1 GTPase Era [Lapidilactobacillus concavus]
MTEFKSGFVALLGRPNVGKSTLMNRLVGEKVAIMSPKAQTTRNKIQGVITDSDAQIVFLDTPGIHKPKNDLDQYMDKAAFSSLNEVDIAIYMTSADDKIGPGDRYILNELASLKTPLFLVINKIDLIHPDDLLTQILAFKDEANFAEVIPLSATQGNNVEELMTEIKSYLPVGPKYYPDDQLTDHPEYFIVGELIREKILEFTRDEVPHSTAVIVEDMNTHQQGKLVINAVIYVDRDSQKGIVIGKGAAMLKKIGIGARREIEALLGEKVNLKLQVSVQRNWRDNPLFLARAGYNQKDLN